MSAETFDADDRDALRALGELGLLGPEEIDHGTRPGDEASEARVRLHTEAAGLLPYGLEAAPAPAALRSRILASVAGEETMAVRGQARRPPSGARPAASPPAPRAQVAPVLVRRSRWPTTLAAALAFVCLGLAGWLFVQLDEQRSQTARLRAQIRLLDQREAELEAIEEQLSAMRQNVGLMTSPGVLACALRPAEGEIHPARGMLFVAADHQHWYLSLKGLPPASAGQTYQLWWDADAGMVSGGTFEVAPGGVAELASATMPRGTRAVVVTVEPAGGSPQPSGPLMLAGSEMQQLL